MNFKGIIIEESLSDPSILNQVEIIDTKVEPVTSDHKTPWVQQWTMHAVEFPVDQADWIADELSKSLDADHADSWYADFKNDAYHYIVYLLKVFKVDLADPTLYEDAKKYGISLGIPAYQVDFIPEDQNAE